MKRNISKCLLIILVFNLISCSKGKDTTPNNDNNGGGGSTQNGITVSTIDATSIKTIIATANCKVVVNSELNSITMKGVVWSTAPNPTTALNTKTADGSSTGTYQSQITNLQSNTKYYIKAYAIDTKGNIVYGNETSFTTKVGWKIVKASHYFGFMAIKDDGTLWGWGNNQSGQLGDGTSISKNLPVQIGTDNDWADVTSGGSDFNNTGFYTLALKTDGSLWAWGKNKSGQLGDGTTADKFIPTKIGNDKWLQISAGHDYSLGIKSDGTTWAWGEITHLVKIYNVTYFTMKTPMQLTNVVNSKYIFSGYDYSLFIKTDGTLWGCGNNSSDALGLGSSTTNIDQPLQQIGTSNNWSKLFCINNSSMATKSDGSCWAWGYGATGNFGSGTNSNYVLPTQISSNLGTIAADISRGSMTYYVKQDGTLWGTGSGVLGDGTPLGNSRFVFTQSGTLNIWKKVANINNATFAIQNNGSLWVCGFDNYYGQLGIGDNDQDTRKLSFTLVD